MQHLKDKVRFFGDRKEALRKEITEAIIALLKENNLTELQLTQNEDYRTYVVWLNRHGNGYDTRVHKVSIVDDDLQLEVEDDADSSMTTLSTEYGHFAFRNIEWLINIFDSMVYTLSLPVSEGIATIAGKTIRWHYDERGVLSELPESEVESITSELNNGKTSGSLCHSDGDLDFEGTWSVVEVPSVKEQIDTQLKIGNKVSMDMAALIRTILTTNHGRISYPLPEGADENDVDFPVSLNLKGDIWNYDFHITAIHLNDVGAICADGFEIIDGVRHDSTQTVYSEHYSQILDFITESLNL